MKQIKRLFLLLTILIIPVFVSAKVVDADDKVTVDKEYNSSHFTFGKTIKSSGKVKGIDFIAGNEIEAAGESMFGAYAGNFISINENVEHDLFVAGNDVNVGSDAVLNRDVYIAANSVKINADVSRNLYVACSTLDISGITVNGNLRTSASNIIMDKDTKIIGKLTYYDSAVIEGKNKATINKTNILSAENVEVKTFQSRVQDFIITLISSYLTLFFLIVCLPGVNKLIKKYTMSPDDVAKKSLIGVCLLVGVPIASLIFMISAVMLPLGLCSLALYCIAIYISSLVTSYIVGIQLAKPLKIKNDYLIALVGVLVVKLLSVVPVVGVFVSLIAMLMGLAVIMKLITKKTI